MANRIIHTQKEYDLRADARQFPMMVVLSFIYVCNARCPNCPYNNSLIRDTYKDAMMMPGSIFKAIADECGPYGSLMRISGGGEPMLHPDIVGLLKYAKQKGARVGLLTNGSRFTEKSLAALIEAGVDALEFSVDAGDARTHGLVRPGISWDDVRNNVCMAVKERDRQGGQTRIIASIINQTGVDVEAARTYWERIVDKVQIRKYLTWGYNDDQSADTTAYLPLDESIPCPWPFERLNVDSRGSVTVCGEDIAFNNKFTNILDRSIKDIWHGPEFTRFRELHLSGKGADIPLCSQCPDWKYRSWKYNYWKVLKDAGRKRHDLRASA